MNDHDLTQLITRLIESNRASTLFLNGPSGAGKSYLLHSLAEYLPSEIQHSFVLGPYQIGEGNLHELSSYIIRDCIKAGYTNQEPVMDSQWDLVRTWKWMGENLNIPTRQTFLVLVDLGITSPKDLDKISTLFSNVRYLEGVWDSSKLRHFHMFAGYWDHPALENHFDRINISFPYTVGHNYIVWTGISTEDMTALVRQRFPTESRIPIGRILYELTAGHPGAALDILNQISGDKMSFSSLLSATRKAALDGQMSKVFLNLWSLLPVESKSILREMIFQRRIPAVSFTQEMERLYLAGIITKKQVGKQSYIDYRSWYVELLVHNHAERLGISNSVSKKIDIDELMPRTSTICNEAFGVINEIENLTRNYISAQLCLQSEHGFHYLMGRSRKYNPDKQVNEDAYQRAEGWQSRSADRGLPVELNPLIAYLSTRDLAILIEELGAEIQSPAWLRIAQAIRILSDVRDAVMHNQLIDDDDLQRLYDLQADIYVALSKPRSSLTHNKNVSGAD